MNGKIVFGLALVLIVFFAGILVLQWNDFSAQKTGLAGLPPKAELTIGVIAPFTGSNAAYGEGIRDGLELALEEINNDPIFDFTIELLYEDNAGEVKNSVSSAQKLITTNRPIALISGVSQHSIAIAPIAEKNKTVLLTMASQATALNNAGNFVFKNDSDYSALGKEVAIKTFNEGRKKAAVLCAAYNDATVDAKNSFVEEFQGLGGKINAVECFDKGTIDYRTALEKIKSSNPEVLFLNALMGDYAAILKQIKESDLKIKLIANAAIEDPQVINNAKETAEGIVFVTYQGFPSEEFKGKNMNAFGHQPKRWSMEAYDGLKILSIAISNIKGEKTTEALRVELSKIHGYDGESGHIEFDERGNAQRQLFTKIIRNGEFIENNDNWSIGTR